MKALVRSASVGVAVLSLLPSVTHGQERQARQDCLDSPKAAVLVGEVRDNSTGKAIEGAQVTIDGTRCGDLTDSIGRYTVTGIPAGDRRVTAQFIGYRKLGGEARFRDGDTARLNFALVATRVYIAGCDPEEIENRPDPIPPGPIPEALALAHAGFSLHGFGCKLKSVRRRIASDSATIALYAQILTGERRVDRDPNRYMLLRWLAASGDARYVPIFLQYADLTADRLTVFDRDAFLGALEGIVRHASSDARAMSYLLALGAAAVEPPVDWLIMREFIRVNSLETRRLLIDALDSGSFLEYQAEIVSRVLDTEPCDPGTLLVRRGSEIRPCSVPEP